MYNPKFTITTDTLNAITSIAETKSIIERSRVLPLNEAQLKRQAIIRMAHTSTSIEGNPLAEFQVEKVLSGKIIYADKKSILEVRNYQGAINEVEKMAQKKQAITIDTILGLHTILMKELLSAEKVGRFRPGTVYVVDDMGNGTEKVRYEGPNFKKVPFLINELLVWLASEKNASLHPIIKAGIFHFQFVTIHPFPDGNGRIARLLTQLILYRAGWDFRKIIVLEDYYNRDRQSYYNALMSAREYPKMSIGKNSWLKYHENCDITPWLEYFTKGFLYEAKVAEEKIASIGFGRATDKNKQVFLDKDELRIMDFITTTGQITSNDVLEVLGIAKRTAQLKLKGLVEKELIKPKGKARATFYTLVE